MQLVVEQQGQEVVDEVEVRADLGWTYCGCEQPEPPPGATVALPLMSFRLAHGYYRLCSEGIEDQEPPPRRVNLRTRPPQVVLKRAGQDGQPETMAAEQSSGRHRSSKGMESITED